MEIFFQILFWICVFAIFHSYVLFPLILKLLARNKSENSIIYRTSDDLPSVSIILASYNEEKNIEKKILSTFQTNYPINKIEFLIGSDNSSDDTNTIIKNCLDKFPQIKLFEFFERQGKIKIINQLKDKAKNDILIFTDSKVFFKENTIYNLVKHFKNKKIGLVGGILINNKTDNQGISVQEDAYMNREMRIKYNEGIIWGCSIGAFGALYAIRPEYYTKIPENFKVDDFFITMKVLINKEKVIFAKDAIADEKLTGDIKEEFKRKVRISTGNYQNLKTFCKYLFNIFKPYSFTFFSHKVIRWLGPFLILFIIISLISLIHIALYQIFTALLLITMLIPLIDLILIKYNINSTLLRFVTHFYSMNIALAVGFIKFAGGVKSAIWDPSQRN